MEALILLFLILIGVLSATLLVGRPVPNARRRERLQSARSEQWNHVKRIVAGDR